MNIRVEPFGPNQARIDRAISALLSHPRLLEFVPPAEHRLLSFALENEGEAADCTVPADKRVEACTADRFVATVYAYAKDRVIGVRDESTSEKQEPPF